MTLKELFLSLDFNRVWAVLLGHYPEMAGSGIGLKQAYDEIRLVEPESDNEAEAIEVDVSHDDDRDYIRVMHCSNDYRRVVAGREVVIAPGLKLSAEELAAHCLWELTYWGFSEEDRVETFRDHMLYWGIDRPINRYWEEYREKDLRWFPPVRLVDYSPKPRNRSKRKRDYRRRKRLHRLRRFAKIEELQQYLAACNIDFDLWPVLKDCGSFTVETDRSYADAPEDAESYICDLYTKYECKTDADEDDYAVTLLIVTGGNKVRTDLSRLRAAIEKHHVNPLILVGNRDADQFTVKFIKALGVKNKPEV